MAALIDDLLVYSRLGRAAMRQQAVDMQSLVADTRAMLDANLQAEAENSGHAHHVEWSIAPLPIVVGDENMIRQVWLNLLGNAVKYSQDGEVRVFVGSNSVSVTDSGPGLSEEDAAKLFQRGYRGTHAGHSQGGGIGLSIVSRLCDLYGWQVSVRPGGERGVIATLTFSPKPL